MKLINNANGILKDWLMQQGVAEDSTTLMVRICTILCIIIIAFILERICRKLIIPAIRKVTSKTEYNWDDHLLSDEVLNNVCHLIPPVVLYVMLPFVWPEATATSDFVRKLCLIYITVAAMRLAYSFISSFYILSNEHEKMKTHSLKGFYQMIKLVVFCIGTIIIISTLIDRSPVVILTGLGAGTAILMLVFQDTIKGLVAGIQLMANDMLRPGDWISMPKYGADGDVVEVTLTSVKVRNWDKTIIMVPPYALVNDSFQNWRGMFEIGGRRIKRSINIDMNTVRFLTKEELATMKEKPWMEGFEAAGDEVVNLHIFRHYIEYYLRHHPRVHQEMILMTRQLQPTAQGLPVELYFFSASTEWIKYENLQSEVFDHILAMMHIFGLKVFQSPTGMDIQKLN